MGILVGAGTAQAQDASAVPSAAREAAQECIESINEREFEDSWDDAAPSFRERVERTRWVQRGTRLADSLGTPSARTLMAAQRRDSLRQTAGPFVVFTYRATFEDAPFEETLVLMKVEEDWRVAGYRLVPPAPSPAPLPLRTER